MEVDHVIVDVDTPHLDLHAIFPGVNSPYVCAVLAVYVAQHALHSGRAFPSDLAEQYAPLVRTGRLRGRRGLCRRTLRGRNLDGRHGGVLGVPGIEGVESAVLGNHREVGLLRKVTHGGFYPHDILRAVSFPGNDGQRADVDVGYGRREEDMHGFRKSHLDGAGCEPLPGRGSVVLGHDFGRGKKSGQKSQINEVSFHGVVV